MKKLIKIGIVGFSRNQFDKKEASKILDELFQSIKRKHSNKEVEIVSGYTNSGVPKIAYELADKYGFTTIGFSANQALKVKSGVYNVKKVILIGEKFGDESKAFVEYIDGLIRIGGGPQSRKETQLFKELNTGKPLQSLVQEYEVDWFGKTKEELALNNKESISKGINGLTIIEDFLSKEDHDKLIDLIDGDEEWSTELRRRVQHYGYKYDYKTRSINTSMKILDLPEWTNQIVKKIMELKLMDKKPDQMIVNEYNPGQGISNHVDCEPCFGDVIISVSLGSTAIMNFINVKSKTVKNITLNPRAVIIMTGESRYNWTHGIPARKTDFINGKKKDRSRRISLTFRNVILAKS